MLVVMSLDARFMSASRSALMQQFPDVKPADAFAGVA